MAASSSLQHRHGMVYLDDSSSGEFSAAEADGPSHLHHNYSHHQQHQQRKLHSHQQQQQQQQSYQGNSTRTGYPQATSVTAAVSASPRSSSRGEDSYDDIYSSSDEGSYFSEGDEIADYWDPYCKFITAG